MNRITTAFTAAFLASGLATAGVGAAHAQTVTEQGLVDSLKPKAKTRSLTRSIGGGQTEASAEDKQFLSTLGTRGIRIDRKEREKLDEIVKKVDLPRIDIEIQFDFDSAAIRADSRPDVDALGKALSSPELASYRIVLNGHTDAKGADAYNQGLSEQRAQSVRDYLIRNFGIEANRLVAIGYGEERLKNQGDPEGAENRRVEVINLTQG